MDPKEKLVQATAQLFGQLESYGATEQHRSEMRRRLAGQRGTPPVDCEVVWELARYGAEHADDLQDAKSIYGQMALFLNRIGRDAFPALAKAATAELKSYKQEGIREVEISVGTGDACSHCLQLNGRRLPIDEALRTMPVPCRECTTEMFDEHHGFCRCAYDMVLDGIVSGPQEPMNAEEEAQVDALMDWLAQQQAQDTPEVLPETNLFRDLEAQA